MIGRSPSGAQTAAAGWTPNLNWITSGLAVGGSFPTERADHLAQALGIRAVVDLQRGAVTEVGSYTPGAVGARPTRDGTPFRVPFSQAERQLAREVALRSPEVRSLLGPSTEGWEVDGLPITQPDREFCPSGRCLLMIFNRGDTYLTSSVMVDVTTRIARIMRGPR